MQTKKTQDLPHNEKLEVRWLQACLDEPSRKMSAIHLPTNAFFRREHKIIHFSMILTGLSTPTRRMVKKIMAERTIDDFFTTTDRDEGPRGEDGTILDFLGDMDAIIPMRKGKFMSDVLFFKITDELLFLYVQRLQVLKNHKRTKPNES